jgi:hypothetical protein
MGSDQYESHPRHYSSLGVLEFRSESEHDTEVKTCVTLLLQDWY